MKVLLLAAGRSKRVKPIEDKNFLKFCGKFLIEHQLEALRGAGFTEIIIIGGAHNLDKLKKVAGDAKVIEQENLDEGMAGAILSAEPHTDGDDIFIVSSNDVVDPHAYELMKSALDSGADSYMLAYKVTDYFPGGYLSLDGKKITGIVEKPGEGNEPSDLINLVLHVHNNPKDLYEALKNTSSGQDDHYEVALNKLMKEKNVEAVTYEGFWQPVKFPWHVIDVMNYYLEKCEGMVSPDATVAETAVIRGHVTIEAGAKIFDNAVIQGPAYIGKDAVIANNALVRNSHIGERSVVGFSTEVARSFVGDDTWFHSNYIGDSIIGNNVSFGAGAVCANLRFDEKNIDTSGRNKLGAIMGDNIRVGVNASIMPGVRIGSGTLIMSGLIVGQDIEANKFVSGKIKLEISDNRVTIDPDARSAMMQSLHTTKSATLN